MKLHPASLAVGAVLAIGVALLSAQQIVGSPAVEVKVIELPANAPIRAFAGEPEMKFLPPGSTWTLDPNGRHFQITAIRDIDGSHSGNSPPCFVKIHRGALTWQLWYSHSTANFGPDGNNWGYGEGPVLNPGDSVEVDPTHRKVIWGHWMAN